MHTENPLNPLHQFEVNVLFPLKLAGYDVSVTNVSLTIFALCVFMCGVGSLAIVRSGREYTSTSVAFEVVYRFVENMFKTYLLKGQQHYFPYIFCLFLFIAAANLYGIFPYGFTITSQLSVTLCLSITVFLVAILLGLWHNGAKFFRLFYPTGTPLFIAPILIIIETISFLFRPVSLALRLFANMIAGHIMIKIFAGFVVLMLESKWMGCFSILPVLLNALLIGFEVIVATLQAYVFTILACIYVNDTLTIH